MRRTGYIPTLDGWRAIAILLVLILHGTIALGASGSPTMRLLAKVTGQAGVGVDIFFCLSGYQIGTLLLQEKATKAKGALGRFYLRRGFRIVPPLLPYLGTIVILDRAGILTGVSPGEILASLGFVRNYLPGSWYTVHFWSLAVEEHFYLIAPIILLFLQSRPAVAIAVALSLASSSWRAIECRTGWATSYLPGTY